MDAVTSVHEKQSSRKVDSHDKHHTVPSRNLVSGPHLLRRDKEFLDGAGPIQSTAVEKRKRPLSSDTFERVPAKFQCRMGDFGASSDQKATRLSAVEQQKPVGNETIATSGVEEKQVPKPKRPAENLTIGTLFDLASHLDAARKKTRRDFDSDLVTVMRKSNEGSCLLHMRPEFIGSEAVSSSPADNLGVDNVETPPLPLCHSDIDSANRLGTLIAANIEQHVDMKKLEHTAKSVSHRLQRGVAKTNEREIVRRPAPVLISTVPRSAANIRGKVQQTNSGMNSTSNLIRDQSAGHIAAKYHQNKVHLPNSVQQHLASGNSGIGSGSRTVNNVSGRHFPAVDNTKSSTVRQLITSDTGSGDAESSRGIIVSKNRNSQLPSRPENLANDGDSKALKNSNRFDVFDCLSVGI